LAEAEKSAQIEKSRTQLGGIVLVGATQANKSGGLVRRNGDHHRMLHALNENRGDNFRGVARDYGVRPPYSLAVAIGSSPNRPHSSRRRRHQHSTTRSPQQTEIAKKKSASAGRHLTIRRPEQVEQKLRRAGFVGTPAPRDKNSSRNVGEREPRRDKSPQRSRLNRLPSRATPYLAPAAGTIITATPLARARE
jgi:hypothetical protein